MQNSWTAWLVGYPVFHSVHKLHHRNNSLHRPGKEFRERSGVCDWFDSARNYLLPDSGVRQRAISRTGRRWFGTENGAAGCVDGFRGSRSIAILAVGWAGVSPAEMRTQWTRQDRGRAAGWKPALRFHPVWVALFVESGDAF